MFAGSGNNEPAKVLSAGLRPGWPFLLKGPATVYTPTTATALGKLRKPHRTQRQLEGRMGTDWPMSPGASPGPAVLVNRFGNQVVHDELSLDIRRDEILGVVGGSGSGKSVLMRSILGLQRPTSHHRNK